MDNPDQKYLNRQRYLHCNSKPLNKDTQKILCSTVFSTRKESLKCSNQFALDLVVNYRTINHSERVSTRRALSPESTICTLCVNDYRLTNKYILPA